MSLCVDSGNAWTIFRPLTGMCPACPALWGGMLYYSKGGTDGMSTLRRKAVKHLTNSRQSIKNKMIAGWSSPVARRAHNPKVTGSNPVPATI
jgi:hypothetical protein